MASLSAEPYAVPESSSWALSLAAVKELERATEKVLTGPWNESLKQRVQALATALGTAYRKAGLRQASAIARSIGCLLSIPDEEICLIEPEFREKLVELMRALRTWVDEL